MSHHPRQMHPATPSGYDARFPQLTWFISVPIAYAFFALWLVALTLAFWALRIAERFAFRMPKTAQAPIYLEEGRFPRVAVILPIKGVEDDTHANVQALLDQDYPEFRLIFAIESDDDPIVPLLEKEALDDSRIEIVIAGHAISRGQKIHNQLAAVSRTTEHDEVLVFIDADARPNPLWLQHLAAPITRPDVGATTGYRYYVPVTDHPANKFVSILNATVAGLLGPYRRTFAWGGSMAIRRCDFYGLGGGAEDVNVPKGRSLHDLWQHALSDDYVLSYYVKSVMKSKLHFVPNCLVASEANFNWPSLFEFATRQYRITRVCAPFIWCLAMGGALIFLSAFVSSLAWAITGLIRPGGYPAFVATVAFLSLYGMNIARGYLLVKGAMRLLPAHADELKTTRTLATFGMPLCYVINFLALLGSALGRTIVWRGITYTLTSHTSTLVQRPHSAPASPNPERTKTPR